MGVRVGATHGRTLVFKDLKVGVLFFGGSDAEFGGSGTVIAVSGGKVSGVESGPGVDNGDDGGGRKVGEGQVVGGVEGNDVAFALNTPGLEKEGGGICKAELEGG